MTNNFFYSEFAKLLLNAIYINNPDIIIEDSSDVIYKAVLSFFSENKTDDTIKNMKLILNSNFTGETVNTLSSLCGCNCNTNTQTTSSCVDLYYKAMEEYLIILLGDVNFYCKYKEIFQNGLAQELINLIEFFLSKNYSLVFSQSINTYSCCKYQMNNSEHIENINIINKYLDVLKYVQTDSICNNVNKININGKEFGKLLPKLEFLIETV